ncbi:MAG TPA: phosphoribosylamine--glycine ligase [Candidatus Limnocylindrales bacterium]|nr:phosphoribosylamine--glycine ligase [Candidatus Limnocylindrales bacterium]
MSALPAARGLPPGSPQRILVLGSGAREHALAWKLAAEPGVERVFVAPGNPLMTDVAELRPEVAVGDGPGVLALARAEGIELVVVGPEGPLVDGTVDGLEAAGVRAFGPTAAAARIEGSKAFCRRVAAEAGVPMAAGEHFEKAGAAVAYAARLGGRCVVKADGLAAGKGVTVCDDLAEAEAAIRDALEGGAFGAAGRRIVVEERLEGAEASVIALCDGQHALALPAARDHKRIGEGDTGPNTGGMGAYSPLPDLPDEAAAALLERFQRPLLRVLARHGAPFRGALYGGLMLTADGPRLLEANARFGDPETQALLPRLDAPLAPLLAACAGGHLLATARELGIDGPALPVRAEASVAVVLAAAGYPGTPRTGDVMQGIEQARAAGGLVFGAGMAAAPGGGHVTAGGRVLTVVAMGPDLPRAADAAHAAASEVRFEGRQSRADIGRRLAVPA